MDGRIRYLVKKSKKYWSPFALAAVVCLIVFFVINFSLNDRSGAFEPLPQSAQTITVPTSRTDLRHINIEATDVKLEVGMVNNVSQPKISLFGSGYDGQRVTTDIKDDTASIVLEETDTTPKTMTMRVLLPQSDLYELSVNGEKLNLSIDAMRATRVNANVEQGYVFVGHVKADGLQVTTNQASVRLSDNQLTQVTVHTGEGSVTSIENKMKLVNIDTESGGVFAYQPHWSGQWTVNTVTGNIDTLSGNLPYNLLVDAKTKIRGSVAVNYTGRYWDTPDIAEASKTAYYGSVGNNPSMAMQYATEAGSITVGKRSRYSNLDPYAADYRFADENPYVKERGTKTK